MAESKLARFRATKSHPLLALNPRKSSNKISVTVHPRVQIPKKHQQKVRHRRSATILNLENSLGNPLRIENAGCTKSQNYLHVHFICANVTGAAPYRFDGNSIKWGLKGPYFVVNALAMLDNLLIVWECIQYASTVNSATDIAVYVEIAKNMGQVMLRIVHVASLWNDADKYANIFTVFDDTSYSAGLPDLKTKIFAFGVPILGLIRALSRALEGITSGVQLMLFRHGRRIIKKITTDWSEPKNIDFQSGVLGMLGFVTSFSGGIVLQAALTGPLMAAATLLSACKEFKYRQEIPPPMEIGTANANNANVPDGLQIGKRYGELKKISKSINHAFSPILKLLLLANLFVFASLIDDIFNGELGKGYRTWILFDAIIACIFLYVANTIGNKGERFREWIHVDQNRIQAGMSQLDVMQEELLSQSIGMGKGSFFVSDGFLIGYAGAIAAYFFGIVETRPKIQVVVDSGLGNQTHDQWE